MPTISGAARSACEHAVADARSNDREQAHAAAIGAWSDGDWSGAAPRLDDLLRSVADRPAGVDARPPTRLLPRRRPEPARPSAAIAARARPDASPRRVRPRDGRVRLEEAGHYGQALDAGLAAVAANPDDVWGIHAVVHTYEMQGLVDDGIRFLASDRTQWESGNLFTVHNWWHLALYHLEAGQPQRSLAIYDAEIHNAGSAGVPIEMLDASALLWRLLLDDVDTGDRFARLAEAWAPKVAGDTVVRVQRSTRRHGPRRSRPTRRRTLRHPGSPALAGRAPRARTSG